jgi:hypothetical protein
MTVPPLPPQPKGVRMMRGVALAFPPGGLVIHCDSQRLEIKQFHLRLNLATNVYVTNKDRSCEATI